MPLVANLITRVDSGGAQLSRREVSIVEHRHTAVVAYDGELADRVRELLAGEPDVVEKRMFGGLAFLVAGRMAVSASSQGGLLVRVNPAETDTLAAEPLASPFVMRGREMTGWLRVAIDVSAPDEELRRWVDHGLRYARLLPPG